MYRVTRSTHRTIGVICACFLILIASTGFLLANKGRLPIMRPVEASSQTAAKIGTIASVSTVLEAAFRAGVPEIQSMADVDRVDYRPKSNIFKVVSKRGYKEIQVSGSTGQVIQIADRNDQLIEDLHDLSFFSDPMHENVLSLIAVGLLILSISGLLIYATPILRRRRFVSRKPRSDLTD